MSSSHHEFPTRMPGWQASLLAAARARRMRPRARPELETMPIARGLGCLVRFILIMVVLFFALVSAVFLFGGSLLQIFLPY